MELLPGERVDVLHHSEYQIIQRDGAFCYGVDAVLLAHFAQVRRGSRVMDLGTGTGIIPLLLTIEKQPAHVTGIEIQTAMADMAARSVRLNRLEEKITVLEMDISQLHSHFPAASVDFITSNPPYMPPGGGLHNPTDAKTIARHEVRITLEEIIRQSARLLRPGGELAMIHKPERLVDIFALMRQYGIEPKALQMVHPAPGKTANLVLVRGNRGGKPYLKMLEPLHVYDGQGRYSAQTDRIYGR